MTNTDQSPPGERLRFAQWAGREEMSNFARDCVVLLFLPQTTLIEWHVEKWMVTSISGIRMFGNDI